MICGMPGRQRVVKKDETSEVLSTLRVGNMENVDKPFVPRK